MVRTFILGSRCLGRDLAGAGFAPRLREGGSLRECPHLKIEIWGTQTRGYLSNQTCVYLSYPGLWLPGEQGARFYVFADEGDGGFERRSRSEDGRDAVLF
jgi:hypothetical protein